jgi:sugar phosphate isomerase/epimerase
LSSSGSAPGGRTPTGRWDPRLSVNAYSSRNLSLPEDLALYEALRVHRVTLSLPKLLARGLEGALSDIAAEIADRGLVVDGIIPAVAFDLSDPTSWGEPRETMALTVEAATRLGASTVQTTGGRGAGMAFEESAERFASAIEPVAREAARQGVRLALEATRPQFAHIAFVHTVRDALRLASDLGLWLVLDTAHGWWEPGVLELYSAAAPRCASLQVADLALDEPVLERLVPGDGHVDLGALIGAALGGGFGGPFELEILGGAIEAEGYEAAIRRSLDRLTALLDAAGVEAAEPARGPAKTPAFGTGRGAGTIRT